MDDQSDVEIDVTEPTKRKAPSDRFANIEPSPLPPIAPDGGFAPGPIGVSAPVPAATPASFICLRGPCRHYWQMETYMETGNPQETWDPEVGLKDPDTGEPVRQPRQLLRTCTVNPACETELTDENVFDCNRWDPLLPRELKKLAKRRAKHLKLFPDHVTTKE